MMPAFVLQRIQTVGLEMERLSKRTEGSPRHVPYVCF